MTTLTDQEFLRYSRHLLIPEVGLAGQEKLKASSALIIGTGGLGSPIALYLAAAGIGRIGLVDYDMVEDSNLQRQIIHDTNTLDKLKVESARARMLGLNPYIQVDSYNEPFTAENAMRIATGYDIIIDGSDNFPTRYLSNDVAVFLGIPNIYGSIYQFDGQASVFYAKEGPCYRCLFPTPPPPHLVPSCADGGVLGVLPGTIGSIQATEAIKVLLGIGSSLVGRLMLYNALEMSFDYVKLKKNPKCPVCSENPTITELIDYEEFCGVPGHHIDEMPNEWDISALDLATEMKSSSPLLLDVREPHEQKISNLPEAKNIPFGELASRLSELNTAQEIVVFCRTGNRSLYAIEILLGAGFRKLKNLEGGINEWAEDVDTSLSIY
ncbi:MAG: molybdopterin-synthase adenylyltransferase MoeB [Anaerolineae bacterium]|jgi:sulfur-carrier protein adenylyltransferase/sulfurtransferase|nr:molybdopterin-synthase adenylyltransferase MoeB [Anaerolineae bacterium]